MTNWFCIEVKTGGTPIRRLVISENVKNELGAPISDPHIGDRVSTNNVEGMLLNPQGGIRKIQFFQNANFNSKYERNLHFLNKCSTSENKLILDQKFNF